MQEFLRIIIQIQRDLGADGLLSALFHGKLRAVIALPVYRYGIRQAGQRIDRDSVGDHEGRVEAQAEMADDLLVRRLILIFFNERSRSREGNLVDILIHFFESHTDTGIDHFQGSGFLIRDNDDSVLPICGLDLAHADQLVLLRDGIGAVGDQLAKKDIVI